MPYRVDISPAAQRQTNRIPKNDLRRIRDSVRALRDNPRPVGCVKLSGYDSVWRMRVGNYRVAYEIFDAEQRIMVLRIARRGERTYRGL